MVSSSQLCRRLQKADAELRKVTNDLRAREREKDAAELRAIAAQAEAEKGSSASQAHAAAKRVSSRPKGCHTVCGTFFLFSFSWKGMLVQYKM